MWPFYVFSGRTRFSGIYSAQLWPIRTKIHRPGTRYCLWYTKMMVTHSPILFKTLARNKILSLIHRNDDAPLTNPFKTLASDITCRVFSIPVAVFIYDVYLTNCLVLYLVKFIGSLKIHTVPLCKQYSSTFKLSY